MCFMESPILVRNIEEPAGGKLAVSPPESMVYICTLLLALPEQIRIAMKEFNDRTSPCMCLGSVGILCSQAEIVLGIRMKRI